MSEAQEYRPKADTPQELDFEKKPMVNWYDPKQLVHTAIKVLTSSAFGSYADKRELMPVLAQHDGEEEKPYFDYSERDELWLDYAADLGDGWNSTYAIASLLAKEKLSLHGEELPRGRLLVMGGDEVYPTATREEYRNRLWGPYRAALPWVKDETKVPHLFAIPGNHDWYDGLTSFLRLFCQGRWFGGWKTQQHRSYFALKLPHNWWLWGLDVQLESDLDKPQIDYFLKVARNSMQAGDKVILCTAEPSWVYAQLGDGTAQRNLDYVEQKIIEKEGKAEVAVTLAGDLHHYCRYQSEDGKRQKITSGGGGAFLHGTHNLPERLEKEALGTKQNYERQGVYPAPEKSRALLYRNLSFCIFNRSFSVFLGFVYLLYAWLMQSASATFNSELLQGSLLVTISSSSSFFEVLKAAGVVHLYSPLTGLVTLAIIGALIAFVEAAPKQRGQRVALGLVHGLAQTLAALTAMTLFAMLNLSDDGLQLEVESFSQILLFSVEMFVAGYLLGGLLMGLHLIISNRWFAMNRTNAMASHRVADYKNFLRLHITDEGLRIIPIAIDKVPRKWRFNGDGPECSPWFEPEQGDIAIRAVEPAISVPTK
jgi:hypothetical protein